MHQDNTSVKDETNAAHCTHPNPLCGTVPGPCWSIYADYSGKLLWLHMFRVCATRTSCWRTQTTRVTFTTYNFKKEIINIRIQRIQEFDLANKDSESEKNDLQDHFLYCSLIKLFNWGHRRTMSFSSVISKTHL